MINRQQARDQRHPPEPGATNDPDRSSGNRIRRVTADGSGWHKDSPVHAGWPGMEYVPPPHRPGHACDQNRFATLDAASLADRQLPTMAATSAALLEPEQHGGPHRRRRNRRITEVTADGSGSLDPTPRPPRIASSTVVNVRQGRRPTATDPPAVSRIDSQRAAAR